MYDSRLGRWMAVDPLKQLYQSYSPYNFCLNNPIIFVDLDGRVIRDQDGKIVYATNGETLVIGHASGQSSVVEIVYVFADDGTAIRVYRNVGKNNGFDTNCYGTTFLDGQYWLDNNEAIELIEADNYKRNISESEVVDRDKILYVGYSAYVSPDGKMEKGDDGKFKRVPDHSVTVVEADPENFDETKVKGLGGVETETSVKKVDDAWPMLKSKTEIIRKETKDKVVTESEVVELKATIKK